MIQDGAGNYDGMVTNGGLKIIPIQVYSRFFHPTDPDLHRIVLNSMDVLRALNYVIDLRQLGFKIAATTLSFGFDMDPSPPCDSEPTGQNFGLAIDTLRNTYGVAVVAAAGNIFDPGTQAGLDPANFSGLDSPACIASAISVGATNDGANPTVAINAPLNGEFFSTRSHPAMDLWAPGSRITSWTWPTGSSTKQGTSFSVPFVAATFARLRARYPSATVSWMLNQLKTHCSTVTDGRHTPNLNTVSQVCYKSMWQ